MTHRRSIIAENAMFEAFRAVAFAPNLNGNARRVAGILLEHFNRETGRCDPSVPRIAKILGINRSTVFRALNDLTKCYHPLFKIVVHGGGNDCNYYRPCWEYLTQIAKKYQGCCREKSDYVKIIDWSQPCDSASRNTAIKPVAKVRPKPSLKTHLMNPPGASDTSAGLSQPPRDRESRNSSGERQVQTLRHYLIQEVPGGKAPSRKIAAEAAQDRKLSKQISQLPDAKAREAAWMAEQERVKA